MFFGVASFLKTFQDKKGRQSGCLLGRLPRRPVLTTSRASQGLIRVRAVPPEASTKSLTACSSLYAWNVFPESLVIFISFSLEPGPLPQMTPFQVLQGRQQRPVNHRAVSRVCWVGGRVVTGDEDMPPPSPPFRLSPGPVRAPVCGPAAGRADAGAGRHP